MIPSLPLSWRDAKVLIESLQGVGVKVPDSWVGRLGSKDGKKKWYSGVKGSQDAPIVELRNHNDENTKQQIFNLHGLLQGLEQPQKKLIVGARTRRMVFWVREWYGSVDGSRQYLPPAAQDRLATVAIHRVLQLGRGHVRRGRCDGVRGR